MKTYFTPTLNNVNRALRLDNQASVKKGIRIHFKNGIEIQQNGFHLKTNFSRKELRCIGIKTTNLKVYTL